MKRNLLKTKNGITLIALVITIIVLLILAGVTIATLMGDNGVLTKSSEAKIKDNHAKVFEALGLESQTHRIEEETNSSTKDLITYLQGKGYIYDNLVVNVQTLLGEKLSTGNGDINGNKDIYKLEEIAEVGKLATTGSEQIKIASNANQNKMYNVVYYDNNEKVTNLGIIGNGTSQAITDQNKEKIINAIGDGIVETLSGEVRKLSLELESGVFKELEELSDENSYLITTNGIKQATTKAFIDKQGKVYTWGSNSRGQLGDGTTEVGDDSNVSIPICISDIEGNILKDKNIVNIVSSGETVVAIDEEGKVYTWGSNYHGELGDGVTEIGYNAYRNIPMCISNLENDLKGKKIINLFSCEYMIIAIDDAGKIYTWGENDEGQLGDGLTNEGDDRNIPICISDIDGSDLKGKKVTSITYGFDSNTVLAMDNEGKVYTWGSNYHGQLGDGTTEVGYNKYRDIPKCISDIDGSDLKGKKVTSISYGLMYDTIIAIDNEGKVYTWGSNYKGQLGDGTTEIGYDKYRDTVKCISDINESDLQGKKITRILCCYDTVIVMDENGKVYTWGDNEKGQLGDGITEIGYGNNRDIPMCISDIEGNILKGKRIVDLIYKKNVVALDDQGKIYTWGDYRPIQCISDISTENNVFYNKKINTMILVDSLEEEFYYYIDDEGKLCYQYIYNPAQ